jgi:hypothetical protein
MIWPERPMVFLSFSDMVLLLTISLFDVIEDVSENISFSSTEGSEAKAGFKKKVLIVKIENMNFIILKVLKPLCVPPNKSMLFGKFPNVGVTLQLQSK